MKAQKNKSLKGGRRMEIETINKEITKTIYKEFCPKCNKEITGTSEGMTLYNLETHLRKHLRNREITEKEIKDHLNKIKNEKA